MRSWTIAVVIGATSLLLEPALPDPLWLTGLPILLPMAAGGLLQHYGVASRLLHGALVGYLLAAFAGHCALRERLPEHLAGELLLVRGQVEGVPEAGAKRQRLVLQVDDVQAPRDVRWRGRLRLSWYVAQDVASVRGVRAGERWQLAVRLKPPRGFSNPGGFDYEAWLLQHRIDAAGYVVNGAGNRRLARATIRPAILREKAAGSIDRALAESPVRGLVKALAVGLRGDISPEQWAVLRATGTGHLIAISGLHIGLAAGFGYVIGAWVSRRFAWVLERCPAQLVASSVALMAALAYAALSGFALPCQRACVMAAAMLGPRLAGWSIPPSKGLALAAIGVVLLDPLAVLAPGFWLSFGAVGLILALVTGAGPDTKAARCGCWLAHVVGGGLRKALDLARVQWVLSLGLLPLTVYWFQSASSVAPLANLMAVPWVSLSAVPPILLGLICLPFSTSLGSFLLEMGAGSLEILMRLLAWSAGQAIPFPTPPAPPLMVVFAATLGVLLILAPLPLRVRLLGFAAWLPLLAPVPERPGQGEFRVTVLDVGQGLAVTIETANHVLVYDAGPPLGESLDAGAVAVTPFLRHRGWRAIDMLVLSNADRDHVGGLRSLRLDWPGTPLIANRPRPGWRSQRCESGRSWEWDQVGFTLLHPGLAVPGNRNNASCVLLVRSSAGSALVPGDVERAAEFALIDQRVEGLASDLLVVPHHGSKTSSTNRWLNAVRPRLAVVSRGYRNRFGQPHAVVRERYQLRGVRWFDTVRDGAVGVHFRHGATPEILRHRHDVARFWRPRDG